MPLLVAYLIKVSLPPQVVTLTLERISCKLCQKYLHFRSLHQPRPPARPGYRDTHTHTPCRSPSSEDDASEVASMNDSLTWSSRRLFRDNSVGSHGSSGSIVHPRALVSDGWTLRCLDRHRYTLYCVGKVGFCITAVPTCCVSILVLLLVRGMAKTSRLFDQQPLLMTQVRASLRLELENLDWEPHAAKGSTSEEEARRKEVQLEVDQLRCSEPTLFLGRLSFHFIQEGEREGGRLECGFGFRARALKTKARWLVTPLHSRELYGISRAPPPDPSPFPLDGI